MTTIKKLPPDIQAFWDSHGGDAFMDKINTSVLTLAHHMSNMSQEALDEASKNWADAGANYLDTAETLFSIQNDYPDKEEWSNSVISVLVKYFVMKGAIELINTPYTCQEAPPKRELGESAENYKKRLQNYINTIK